MLPHRPRYNPSQYDPPKALLESWENRRKECRTARDLVDVHITCLPFFDEFYPQATVYVHGSFARDLQTEDSDVNLYIPSACRKNFDDAWAISPLRKPMASNPKKGMLVHEMLQDELCRYVSISCRDDAGFWMAGDVKVQIYPILEGPAIRPPIVKNRNDRPQILNMFRKAWYMLQRFEQEQEILRNRFNLPITPAGCYELCCSQPSQKTLFFSVVHNLYLHFVVIQMDEWEDCSAEKQEAKSLIIFFGDLWDDMKDYGGRDTDFYWYFVGERFKRIAEKLHSFEGVFPY